MMKAKDVWEEVYERNNIPWVNNPIPIDILNEFSLYFKPGDKILDYGAGNGILTKVLLNEGLQVTCSDISDKALVLAKEKIPNIEIIQASNPSEFLLKNSIFDGILLWGVLHHIDIQEWPSYFDSFYKILKNDGLFLIGGHGTKDSEFKFGSRISPTTQLTSYAVNSIEDIIPNNNFLIEKSGYFDFKEAYTGSQRIFKYYLLRKT